MGFKNFLYFEARRIFCIRKALILLLFCLFSVYFIQSGISQYKENLGEKGHFQEFEKIRVENFQYYVQYGTYGFRLLFIPGPLSALISNAGIIHANLNAFIDSGERMKIYESFKGKTPFIGYTSIFMNLTGFILLFYSLLVLFYGLESYRNHDFLKFLECKLSRKKLFMSVFFSRLFLLFAWCLIISLTVWFLYILNGITGINVGMFALYNLVAFLMLGFFLFVGMMAGTYKNKFNRIAVVISVWLIFVFLIPAVVGKIVYHRAESILSTYKMEIEKFKVMMSIEKKALEQAGKLDVKNTNTEIRRQLHEYFWNNEFKTIFGYEQSMINEMKDVVSLYHNLSLFFPTSFFLSTNNEISGCGYESLIGFYDHAYKLKMGFTQYYAEKNFYSGEKTVKPFLNGDENIFHASSHLPAKFDFGLVISLLWLLLLLYLLWNRFNRMLDSVQDTQRDLNPDELKNNKTNVIFTLDKGLLPQLIKKLRLILKNILAVPGPDSLPGDTTVKNLFSLFGLAMPEAIKEIAGKYVFTLEPDQKGKVLLEIAEALKADILIFDNFLAGLSDAFIHYFASTIKLMKKGRKVVYFTNSILINTIIGDWIKRFNDEDIPF
jgi:hypothetical protein